VHLPAHHQVCARHGIWLSGPEAPQFSVRDCPDILEAERLARPRSIEETVYATVQAPEGRDEHAWKRRTAALVKSNPRTLTETSPQALFQAAAYPDAVAFASRKSPA
jgi:hypothetical protein